MNMSPIVIYKKQNIHMVNSPTHMYSIHCEVDFSKDGQSQWNATLPSLYVNIKLQLSRKMRAKSGCKKFSLHTVTLFTVCR